MATLRKEYPRPDFVRADWQSLNGPWQFAMADAVDDDRYVHSPELFDLEIQVPFVFQSEQSGIGIRDPKRVVWYRRTFSCPEAWQGQSIRLHFGAVDYEAVVWVNGQYAGNHRGGYTGFSIDITRLLSENSNTLVVKVIDEDTTSQPRGKQSANRDNWGCWYVRSTGIWQSVWLEPVGDVYVNHVRLVPDIDTETLEVEYSLNNVREGLQICFAASFAGRQVTQITEEVPVRYSHYGDLLPRPENRLRLSIAHPQLWSPETPYLYELTIQLYDGETLLDTAATYFGMRKVETRDGQVYLNNEPVYLRMVLDQGYWRAGIYTPTSAEDYAEDIRLMKESGFNGVRKHQKIEDPYFYYHCDRLGLLVWAEMPSCYIYDETGVQNITREWQAVVRRLYNFPSIMAWVPMNESWGVEALHSRTRTDARPQYHLQALYYATKALDSTRLVVGNDGWQQANTDLIAIHEYTQDAVDLVRRFRRFQADPAAAAFSHGRPVLLPGFAYEGQPILVTEYGGVKVEAQGAEGWGYGDAARDYPEMLDRMRALTDAILAEPDIAGYCYTQLTDVEQEVNGILTFEHEPKVGLEQYREVFGRNPADW